MADNGGASVTGLNELRTAVDQLPRDVTTALRSVASGTAQRIRTRAQQLLRSKTHGTGATADAIVVFEEPAKQQFVVQALAPPGKPANLPLWLEYGTSKMVARPFMRPAADAENERYQRDSLAAATAVVDKLGKL